MSSSGRRVLTASAQADLSLRWAHRPFPLICHDAAHFNNHVHIVTNVLLTECVSTCVHVYGCI